MTEVELAHHLGVGDGLRCYLGKLPHDLEHPVCLRHPDDYFRGLEKGKQAGYGFVNKWDSKEGASRILSLATGSPPIAHQTGRAPDVQAPGSLGRNGTKAAVEIQPSGLSVQDGRTTTKENIPPGLVWATRPSWVWICLLLMIVLETLWGIFTM